MSESKKVFGAFCGIWVIMVLMLWTAKALVWPSAIDSDALAKLFAISFVFAFFVALFAAWTWNKGFDSGGEEIRATEVPAARERGRVAGREETMDVVSGGTHPFSDLPDEMIYEIGEIREFGDSDVLVIMEFWPAGENSERNWLVQMSRQEAQGLETGHRYRFVRDADPQFDIVG